MLKQTSGKIFRFNLHFDLGYGFAEVYDFTDIFSVDGIKVFVFNRIDTLAQKTYSQSEITSSGIAMGPITLYRYPNSRGKNAWKYLFKSDSYILEEPPVSKEGQDRTPWTYDWSLLQKWYRSDRDPNIWPPYVPYEEVRSLETRILNSPGGVVTKATMKYLIDNGKKVEEYYNLSDLGNVNMFIQLVNTYYSKEKCRELIKLIPVNTPPV